MNLSVFAQWNFLLGGLALGLMTLLLTGGAMWLSLALFGFRSRLTAFAEASAAGNATATPAAIAAAATAAGSPNAAAYRPVGIAQGPDGSIFVTDDVKGRIWRISYNAAP
jgi:hypothetical protein